MRLLIYHDFNTAIESERARRHNYAGGFVDGGDFRQQETLAPRTVFNARFQNPNRYGTSLSWKQLDAGSEQIISLAQRPAQVAQGVALAVRGFYRNHLPSSNTPPFLQGPCDTYAARGLIGHPPFFDMQVIPVASTFCAVVAVAKCLEFLAFAAQLCIAARGRTERLVAREVKMHRFEARNDTALSIRGTPFVAALRPALAPALQNTLQHLGGGRLGDIIAELKFRRFAALGQQCDAGNQALSELGGFKPAAAARQLRGISRRKIRLHVNP